MRVLCKEMTKDFDLIQCIPAIKQVVTYIKNLYINNTPKIVQSAWDLADHIKMMLNILKNLKDFYYRCQGLNSNYYFVKALQQTDNKNYLCLT